MEYIKLTWEDIEQLVENVYKQLVEKKYFPNYIIALGRGGMIPARLIADKFSIKDVSMINVSLYKNAGIKNNTIKIENFNNIIEKKNILLIDDISDSGETIEKVIEYLKDKRANALKTATLLIRDNLIRIPSFVGKTIRKEWIIFPWEKEEFKDHK